MGKLVQLPRPHLDYDPVEMGRRVAWHSRPLPQSDQEWQYAVDLVEIMLSIEAAQLFGLITGGPSVRRDTCEWFLEAAARRGIVPAPTDALLELVIAELMEPA